MFAIMQIDNKTKAVSVYDTDDTGVDLASEDLLGKLSVEIDGKTIKSDGSVSYALGDMYNAVQLAYATYMLKAALLNGVSTETANTISQGFDIIDSLSGVVFTTDRINPYIPNGVTFLQSCYNKDNVAVDVEGLPYVQFNSMALKNEYMAVELPLTLRVLKSYTFLSAMLNEILLNEGLLRIDSYAFTHSVLAEVSVPDTVYSIGVGAFARCRRLKKVRLSAGVEQIQKDTFFGCDNLAEVQGIEHIKAVGTRAFTRCNMLSKLNLRDVQEVLEDGFYNSGLKQITLGKCLTFLGSKAFANSRALVKVEFLGNKLDILSDCCFNMCINLREVKLPDNLKTIGVMAFNQCRALESIVIPDTVEVIEDLAFRQCSSLKSLKLPKALVRIGSRALDGVSLESLFVPIACKAFGWGTDFHKAVEDAKHSTVKCLLGSGKCLLGLFYCSHLSIPFNIFYMLYTADAIRYLYPYGIQTLELRADEVSKQVQDKNFAVIVPDTLVTLRLKGIQSKFKVARLRSDGSKTNEGIKIEYN